MTPPEQQKEHERRADAAERERIMRAISRANVVDFVGYRKGKRQ